MRPRARVAENLSQYPVATEREDIAVPARPSPNNSRTETRTERVSGNPSSLILLSFSCAPRSLSHCPNDFHIDRKSTRLNSSHSQISYAVFCLKKKKKKK